MAKKNVTAEPPAGRPLQIEDLEQIVGGAATHQQYDAAKQTILNEINNADIANAVAADAAAIASNPANVASTIASLESHASADHVSQAAALAALDAATYGNAKVNGTDAVAAELTKVLTNGSGEADMAHLAAQGAGPQGLVAELNQAVGVLAMGSANGQTALGLQTNAAVDWVEAKLEAAAAKEASADQTLVSNDQTQVVQGAMKVMADTVSFFSFQPGAAATLASDQAALQADESALSTAQAEVQGASSLQSLLDTAHQGEVAEGKGIDAVMTAIGTHAAQIAADAAALQGLTGQAAVTAGLAEATAVESITGVQKDVALVALDLFAQGNAGVQQVLSQELSSGAIETNLAQAVATGGLTGDQAVQSLNLVVADLAQNSVDPSTIPALEQGFATAAADVALANAAAALAAADTHEAAAVASQYNGQALEAMYNQQAQLAASLQTLINTNYSGEIALANELSAITSELGGNAATYIADGGTLITNPSLAAGYISAIEAAGQAAETSATVGSTNGAFSVDGALTLLAAYSHGNPTVLNEIETRLVNGSAEADLAHLTEIGAITATQAVTTLSGLVDALAANSPNNSVTLTGSDGHQIVLDRGSAVDWAEAQLTKAAVPLQNALAQDVSSIAAAAAAGNIAGMLSGMLNLGKATVESVNATQLVNLLETTHGNEVLEGLGIDIGWNAMSASADAAAAIAAGTHMVQSNYDGHTVQVSEVDASATALANSINAQAQTFALNDLALARSIMELNLTNATASEVGNDSQVQTTVNQISGAVETEFAAGLSLGEAIDPDINETVDVIKDPSSLSAWESLGASAITSVAMDAAGVGILEKIGAVDRGMVWLLNEDAVSHVLGSELTSDLKGYYQTAADVCDGITAVFKDDITNSMDLVISGGKALVTDLVNNMAIMGQDLASGNLSALPHDLQNMVSAFGTDLGNYAQDWVNTGEKDVTETFHDITTMFGNMANDIMSSPDIAKAVTWVDQQGQALLTDLSNIGISVSEVENWFSSTAGDALKEVEELGSGIANLPNDVLQGIENLGGDVENGLVQLGDDIASVY
jgi:hypothetical protein